MNLKQTRCFGKYGLSIIRMRMYYNVLSDSTQLASHKPQILCNNNFTRKATGSNFLTKSLSYVTLGKLKTPIILPNSNQLPSPPKKQKRKLILLLADLKEQQDLIVGYYRIGF